MKTFTLIATLLFAPVALAEDTPKTTTTAPVGGSATATDKTVKPGKLSKSELQVLAHYHELNKMEVDLGNAAVKNAKADAVKEYGRMLVQHHGAADKELMALAKKRGQKIPAEKPMTDIEKQDKAQSKKTAAQLKKLKGAEFDTAFLAAMIVDHEKELAKADAKVAQVKDAELADMIRKQKPTLQLHADRARELQKQLGGDQVSSAGSTSGTSPTTTPPAQNPTQARRPNQ